MNRAPLYFAEDSRILSRTGAPVWLTIAEARRQLLAHADLACSAEPGPDLHLRAIKDLVWAIRDAEAGAELDAWEAETATIERRAA